MTQRNLGKTTQELARSFERLSSGLRINRASDDAAGLAIADSLRSDRRVLLQGMRNLNDGISLISIAESAVTELKSIVLRVQELAGQAASGTYSTEQRIAMDNEAQALVEEFNRITETTDFNGINLFSNQTIAIQAGNDSSSTS